MKDETNKVRYVYIHDKYMNRPNFLEDVFSALGIAGTCIHVYYV